MNEQKIDSQEESSEDEVAGIQVGNKEIFSTDMTIRLVEYNIEDYAGIHMPEDTSLVVKFPTGKEPVMVGVRGDQGIGKTSFMRCAMELLGGDIAKNGINEISKTKKASITMTDTRNGIQYIAKLSKKTFSLSQVQDVGGKKLISDVKTPKEFLRTLIGPIGVNPMELAEMKPGPQIKWVRDLFDLSEEDLEKEKKILAGKKKATADRKNVARDLLRVRNGLTAAGWAKYNATTKVLSLTEEYNKQKKFYTQDVKERQALITKDFEEANKRRNEKELEEKEMEGIVLSLTNVDKEILDLEERLKNLRGRKDQLDIQKQQSEIRLSDYIDVEEKYATAQTAMNKMSEYIQGRTNIENVDKALLEYDQYEESWKMFQSQLDDYNQLHKKFVQLFTPDIEGIEICVPSEIDIATEREIFLSENEGASDEQVSEYINSLSSETREGIYYHGRTMDQLSESEVWEVAMMFWSLNGVNVAFIENVQSLGSQAKERIEWLARRGCTIFFSAMKRTEKELKAEFYSTIPE